MVNDNSLQGDDDESVGVEQAKFETKHEDLQIGVDLDLLEQFDSLIFKNELNLLQDLLVNWDTLCVKYDAGTFDDIRYDSDILHDAVTCDDIRHDSDRLHDAVTFDDIRHDSGRLHDAVTFDDIRHDSGRLYDAVTFDDIRHDGDIGVVSDENDNVGIINTSD